MERWESKISTHPLDAASRFLRGLPSLWRAKREAGRLFEGLPDYSGALQLPGSDEIFSWVQDLCKTEHRRPGTPEGHRAERWVADRLREFGMASVNLDPVPITVWNGKRWSLKVQDRLIPSFFLVNSGFTGPEGITAPLVYVGSGRPRDFQRTDVSGKIVVADVPFPYLPTGLLLLFLRLVGAAYHISDPTRSLSLRTGQYLNFVRPNFIGGTGEKDAPEHDVYWQAHKRGARAVCLILKNQPSNSNSHYGPYDGIMKPMPGLWVGKHDGLELRRQAKKQARATVVLEGETSPGTMHNVWAVLPGMSEEIILVTSHHDAPFQGAVEDGTGVAQVLAQARIWSAVPREKRPKTLVFVVDAGHFYGSEGAYHFVREHEDLVKKARILITLEHLAAREVKERGEGYEKTGRAALTVMFTSTEPHVIASVTKALKKRPAPCTVPVPFDLLAPAPTSDAAWYVLKAGVPVVSWIGCPYYLLDEHDTLDMVDQELLAPLCETVTELVKTYMVL